MRQRYPPQGSLCSARSCSTDAINRSDRAGIKAGPSAVDNHSEEGGPLTDPPLVDAWGLLASINSFCMKLPFDKMALSN